MSKTMAVLGAGTGLGRSVARRFGRAGFRVALVARRKPRLDQLVAQLRDEGVDARGFAADLADRRAAVAVLDAITAELGPLDVVEYAPAGLDLVQRQVSVLDADVESFEFGLDLLLRTPVAVVRAVLPQMMARGDGALLFGTGAAAGTPFPQVANVGTAAIAARGYLLNLNAALADTGVYVGLLQVAGMVGDSEPAEFMAARYGAAELPTPLDPADLAEACWNLYRKRDTFEVVVGGEASR
jgi:NADP-dependent 3-hydroxy acid dehydrogenase YdfG